MTQTRYLFNHRCENARKGKLSVKEVLSWSAEKKKCIFGQMFVGGDGLIM